MQKLTSEQATFTKLRDIPFMFEGFQWGSGTEPSHGNAEALSTFSTCRAHADLVRYDAEPLGSLPLAPVIWLPLEEDRSDPNETVLLTYVGAVDANPIFIEWYLRTDQHDHS